jgi:ferredoxin
MKRLLFVEKLMRWKLYPDVLRIPVLVVFTYILYLILFGDQAHGANPGLSLVWILWWALLPVLLVILGRFWCAICPFGTVGDWLRKIIRNDIHPPLFLKRHGVWFAYGFFIFILSIETLVQMDGSTSASSILIFTLFTMAIISGAFFRNKPWCRYLCPLGVTGGIFSRLRIIELTSDSSTCKDCKEIACIKGTINSEGCPMGLCMKKHDMDADCISCGRCFKNCPNDSPRIQIRSPVQGFIANIKLTEAESYFSSSFIGLSIALFLIKDYLVTINRTFGFEKTLWNEILAIFVMMGITFSFFYLFSVVIKPLTKKSQKHNFMFFGFFLAPFVFIFLFNIYSVREVLLNGATLYIHILKLIGLDFPVPSFQHLLSLQITHLIQGVLIMTGSIISILFFYNELKKVITKKERKKHIIAFSIFLTIITSFSIYLFLFL